MKIAHISDMHIRNLKFHDNYMLTLDSLYEELEKVKPDLIINTGDTAHSKNQISPEFVKLVSEHMKTISMIAPYHIILGNHDFNIHNFERLDAISPIVNSINSNEITLHVKSGFAFNKMENDQKYTFWVFSLSDMINFPIKSDWDKCTSCVNIGLFHGAMNGCTSDVGWECKESGHNFDMFDGLDFVMLGHIHKQQSFRNNTIAYAGSIIQQNFGESLDKGFLLWELGKKNEQHYIKFVKLKNHRPFHVIELQKDLKIPNLNISKGSQVRIDFPRSVSLKEQDDVKEEIIKKFNPVNIVMKTSQDLNYNIVSFIQNNISTKELRKLDCQEHLIRKFLNNKNVSDVMLAKILDINKKIQSCIESKEENVRNIRWSIDSIVWDNMFNFGKDNIIDFKLMSGLTGLFAPNGSGKSNIIDIILVTCFDSITKGVNKNIFLINDELNYARSAVKFSIDGERYVINRTINIENSKNKEWGKTKVDFCRIGKDKDETLVGTTRQETEKIIRNHLGTFDDFMLTSLFAQWNPLDIIEAKNTKRKEILYRFLDLDLFNEKAILAKEESKDLFQHIKKFKHDKIDSIIEDHLSNLSNKQCELKKYEDDITKYNKIILNLEEKILNLLSNKKLNDVLEKKDWKGLINIVEEKIRDCNIDVDNINSQLTKFNEELNKIEKLSSRFDVVSYEKKEVHYNDLNITLSNNEQNLKNSRLKLSMLEDSVKSLGIIKCTKCGSSIEIKNSSSNIIELNSIISKIIRQRDELLKRIKLLNLDVEKLNLYRNFMSRGTDISIKKKNLNLKLENIQLKLDAFNKDMQCLMFEMGQFDRMKDALEFNRLLDMEIDALNNEKRTHQNTLDTLRKNVIEINRAIGSCQYALNDATAKLIEQKKIIEECSAYNHYIEMMGKDGIAYNVMKDKLLVINDEINKILSDKVNFSVTLEQDDEQSISFYLQYKDNSKKRLLELCSGAEKFISSLAIRSALLSISTLPKADILIMDEGFGKLDPNYLESVQKMFDYLKSMFKHVLIISHLDIMKDVVDNIIEIGKDEDGYAHVNMEI